MGCEVSPAELLFRLKGRHLRLGADRNSFWAEVEDGAKTHWGITLEGAIEAALEEIATMPRREVA